MGDPTTAALYLTFFGTLGVAFVMFLGLVAVFVTTLVIAGIGRLAAVAVFAIASGVSRLAGVSAAAVRPGLPSASASVAQRSPEAAPFTESATERHSPPSALRRAVEEAPETGRHQGPVRERKAG